MDFNPADLGLALPEIFLAVFGMALLLHGALRGDRASPIVSVLAALALVVAAVLVIGSKDGEVTAFGGMFVVDAFAIFFKVLVLAGSAVAIVLSLGFLERAGAARPEYPVLVLFATVGMLLMVSANDLIALYVGLELQSLSLYVLAAYQRDSVRSTEAGLKYFVLGALSSGMLLYGSSMVYGFAGTTGFAELAQVLHDTPPIGVVIGLVFVIAGLAFKVSAVPFHMWTPDVYEGAPTPITAFFAVAPKLAAMALLLRVMMEPFGGLMAQWQQIVVVVAIASMVLGALAAINQTNIKRLMAYSSIGHVGYALVGLAAGTADGIRGVLIYMAIYMVMNIGTFVCILCMRRRQQMVEQIDDLAGLAKTQPALALALAVFMFSMAGIPPAAGFFGKFFVFKAAIDAGLYTLAVIGVLSSVVGAYYYVRIVKLMYFDEPGEAFDRPIGREMAALLLVTAVPTALFFVFPAPVVAGATAAAQALL